MKGEGGNDIFRFSQGSYGTLAPSAHRFDTIMDWTSGDTIDYTNADLSIPSDATEEPVAGRAKISNGVATFHGDDDTLAEQIIAVNQALTANSPVAGEVAVFSWGSDGYVFISDGTPEIGANDILIKIVGLQPTTGVTITSGDITGIA